MTLNGDFALNSVLPGMFGALKPGFRSLANGNGIFVSLISVNMYFLIKKIWVGLCSSSAYIKGWIQWLNSVFVVNYNL